MSRDHRTQVLLKSVVRSWSAALRSADQACLIFSPFITSRTSERVISAGTPTAIRIFTRFDAELFAQGGSSLQTLAQLARLGCAVHYIDGLHAKMVLTDRFATVGSQNLTQGGTRQREATAIIRDPQTVALLRRSVEPWVEAAIPISTEMIADMAKRVRALRRNALELQRASVAIDTEVRQHEAARRDAERRSAIERAIRASRASRAATLTLTRRGHVRTLLAPKGVNLLRWRVGDDVVELVARDRYLLIHRSSERLAWVALNKTRLTQFARGLWKVHVEFDGVRLPARIQFPQTVEPDGANVVVTLGTKDPFLVTIGARFDLSTVEIVRTSSARRLPASLVAVRDAARAHDTALVDALRARLLEPFQFARNRHGVQPDRFLPVPFAHHRLTLHRARNGAGCFFVLG